MRFIRYKLRTLLGCIALIACALAAHTNSMRTHLHDVRVVSSIPGAPMDANLPLVRSLGCPPNGIGVNAGHAYFEYVGAGAARRLALDLDLRYSCRVTTIILIGNVYTDSSLERFGELAHLRRLDLRNTLVSDAAIENLKTQLPALAVRRQP